MHRLCTDTRSFDVPGELTDSIIDQLEFDTSALGTCALVSSEWLRRSRYYTFSTIRLCPRRSPNFINLIKGAHESISAHVRRMELDGGPLDYNGTPTWAAWLMETLECLHLPNLTSISLRNFDWTSVSPPTQHQLLSRLSKLKTLTHLDFDGVTFHDLREVTSIANSFPLLRHLSINVTFLKYQDQAVASATTLHLPSTLEHVEIGSSDAIPVVLSCLAAQRRATDAVRGQAIETLNVRTIQKGHLPHIRHTIRGVGPQLHELILGFDDGPALGGAFDVSKDEVLEALSLSRLTSLRHLSFEGLRSGDGMVESIIPQLLSRIESPFLQSISFAVSITRPELPALNFDHLQRVLLELHFFGLREAKFRVRLPSGDPPGDHIPEYVLRKALGELDGRGVLRVDSFSEQTRESGGSHREVRGEDVSKASDHPSLLRAL